MIRITTLATLLALSVSCFAQDGVLQKWDFEKDEGGWKSFDQQGKVSLTMEKDCVYEGASALQFDYRQRTPDAGAAQRGLGGLPGTVGVELTKPYPQLKSISLAVSTSVSVPLGIVLRERNGATYTCPVFSNAGQWNVVLLDLDDFALDEGSSDPDGKLDAGHIVGIGVVDASVLTRALKQAGVPLYTDPEGPATMWLDDIKLLSTPGPAHKIGIVPPKGEPIYIDNCDGPTIQWAMLGGTMLKLSLQKQGAAAGSCLKVDYQLPAGTVMVLVHQVKVGQLAGAKALVLSLKAEAGCTLAIVLEGKGGGRYIKSQRLEGGQDWLRQELRFTDFKPDGMSKDADGTLDPADIKQIGIADLAGLVGQAYANTIYVDEVAAVK
jgi:hypothetical protein